MTKPLPVAVRYVQAQIADLERLRDERTETYNQAVADLEVARQDLDALDDLIDELTAGLTRL